MPPPPPSRVSSSLSARSPNAFSPPQDKVTRNDASGQLEIDYLPLTGSESSSQDARAAGTRPRCCSRPDCEPVPWS
jgi:hypothetical protein